MNSAFKTLFVPLLSLLCFFQSASLAEEGAYRLMVGDMLQVQVAFHPELSVETNILPDGTLMLPLIGSVKVEGLTPEEAKKLLEELYDKNYIANPTVVLNVMKNTVQEFFVDGEVLKPGVYPLKPGLTTLMGIVMAAGFTPLAKKENVKILRRAGGKKQVFEVNIRLVENGDIEKDVDLMPDDIIVVSK